MVQRKTTTGKESAFKTGEKHQTTRRSFGFGLVSRRVVAYLLTVQTQCGGREQDVVLPQRRKVHSFCVDYVDKELFTSFLNPKNVFPVAVLLELVLRSVLNHQGIPISFILQILAKKTQISLTGTMLDTCTRKQQGGLLNH